MKETEETCKQKFTQWTSLRYEENQVTEMIRDLDTMCDFAHRLDHDARSVYELSDVQEGQRWFEQLQNNEMFSFLYRDEMAQMKRTALVFCDFILAEQFREMLRSAQEKPEVGEMRQQEQPQKGDPVSENHELYQVDFESNKKYAYSTPVAVFIEGQQFLANSWKEVYRTILKWLYHKKPEAIEALIGTIFPIGRRVEIVEKRDVQTLRRPMQLVENVFVEGNLSATQIIQHIRFFLDICGCPRSAVVIQYFVGPEEPAEANVSEQESPMNEECEPDETEVDAEKPEENEQVLLLQALGENISTWTPQVLFRQIKSERRTFVAGFYTENGVSISTEKRVDTDLTDTSDKQKCLKAVRFSMKPFPYDPDADYWLIVKDAITQEEVIRQNVKIHLEQD